MNPYGPQQLANAIRTVRKNTILVAADIPDLRITRPRIQVSPKRSGASNGSDVNR